MPTLTPVDYDPFAAKPPGTGLDDIAQASLAAEGRAPSGPRLTPVDYDPFASGAFDPKKPHDFVRAEAARLGVDPDIALRMMNAESGGKADAVSPKGARGYFQLMPETAKGLGVDPNDPQQNITGGITYFKRMLDRYKGDTSKALAAYNAGPGNVDKYGGIPPFAETQAYVEKVRKPMPFSQNLAMGLADPIHGATQAVTHALPGVTNWVNRQAESLNNLPVIGPITKAMGMTPLPAEGIDAMLAQREKGYQDRRAVSGESGFDTGRVLGNMATTLPMMAAIPGGSTLAGSALSGVASGALMGAASPVTDQSRNYTDQKLEQAGTGALLGGVLSPVATLAGRAIAPSVSPAVRKLTDEGVKLTPGQILGGTAKRIEDAATSIPLVGDKIAQAQRLSVETMNRAAINRTLAPIGEELPKGVNAGHEAVQYASKKISEAFDEVVPKLVGVADRQFGSEVNNLVQMASNLPKAQADQFLKIVQTQIGDKLNPTGTMLGEAVQRTNSELGRLASVYKRDPSADQKLLGDALFELQSSFRSMLVRANPDYAPRLSAANEAFSNLLRVQRAAGSTASVDGVFSPNALAQAVKAGDTSGRKAASSKGDALMQDLANAAKGVIPSRVPDSGTALRSAVGLGAFGAGGAINPAIPAVGAGVYGLYTQPAQRAIQSLLAGQRPQSVQAAGNLIAKSGRGLTPAGLGLLN